MNHVRDGLSIDSFLPVLFPSMQWESFLAISFFRATLFLIHYTLRVRFLHEELSTAHTGLPLYSRLGDCLYFPMIHLDIKDKAQSLQGLAQAMRMKFGIGSHARSSFCFVLASDDSFLS
jgi:hypothetical protein